MNLNEQLNSEFIKLEQAKRREQLKEQREKVAQRKRDTARYIIIGRLVAKIFPEVSQFNLQRTRTANEVEFMPLEIFLTRLSADTKYVAKLKTEVTDYCTTIK